MQIRSVCLGTAPGAAIPLLLQAAIAQLREEAPGLQQVQLLRVLRHIPTDSLNDSKAYAGVVPQADAIAAVLEFYWGAEAASGPAWEILLQQVRAVAPVLFMLDSQPNIPIAPRGAAVHGGFRRWMLLARKAATQEAFRDAWFGRHATLVRELPQVDGYLQNLVTRRWDGQGREAGYEALPVDGIAQLCYADEAAMNASYASDARLPLRDDGRELLGRITTTLVQGEVVS